MWYKGPPTRPFIGNEHQIPPTNSHFLCVVPDCRTVEAIIKLTLTRLTKWAKQYGGILSLQRFKSTTLVITDWMLVKALFDKRSNLYSDRPASLVAHLITQSDHLLVMQYGDDWRKLRKLIHQYFMESMCEKHHWQVQEAEAIQMLHDFLSRPEDHMLHPKRYSNSIINSLGTFVSAIIRCLC